MIILWHTINYKKITTLTGHTGWVNYVYFKEEQYDLFW